VCNYIWDVVKAVTPDAMDLILAILWKYMPYKLPYYVFRVNAHGGAVLYSFI